MNTPFRSRVEARQIECPGTDIRQRTSVTAPSHTARAMLDLIELPFRDWVRSCACWATFQAALGYQAERGSGALDEARAAGMPG